MRRSNWVRIGDLPLGPCTMVLTSLIVAIIVLGALFYLTMTASAAAHPAPVAGQPEGILSHAKAAPIPPPEGYPKLKLSTKLVTPTLVGRGGATLKYLIEIRNTGATTATDTTLLDSLPAGTSYNGDAWASGGMTPQVTDSTLTWLGDVGFDASVFITYSLDVDAAYQGTVRNGAVITNPSVAHPITVSAEAVVTDDPILHLEKSATPAKPGANKPLIYAVTVSNWGQTAVNLPITVTDRVPLSTTLRSVGPGGTLVLSDEVVTWTRSVNLGLGESTVFTFSVDVGDVPSGTVITNEDYAVRAPFGITVGQPHTVTVVDPQLELHKRVWPDPPGSNRELTYTLSLFNAGSFATDLVVTDAVPTGVHYERGGLESSGMVSWALPSLATGKTARFTFTVYVSDVINVPIVNDDYGACSAEGVCARGEPVTSMVEGPVFETYAMLDPIAHKPGGGTGTEVTPTLVVQNVGAGNAVDAQATLFFGRLSVQASDLYADPAIGALPPFPDGPPCGDKCRSYIWIGSLGHGDAVTFTTPEGQSTIGGDEGTNYTATVVITDSLGARTTRPLTATAIGTVTHMANVRPIKTAPPVVGPGQWLTYTLNVYNRGLTTQLPPILTDAIPSNTSFVQASHDGISLTVSDTQMVSWTLPLLSPGEGVVRTLTVRTDADLVSGTKVVNRDYAVFGYGNMVTGTLTSGPPVTTTVQEVGLIDSFKVVTPHLALPGPGNLFTYAIHLVNSSGIALTGVTAEDVLPWAGSTYRRDAVASAGDVVSDIISLDWQGDIDPFSEVVITGSVLADADFSGALTNTVVISHPDLMASVERQAVAYVLAEPLLRIQKSATPSPVPIDQLLTFHLRVTNLGQQATSLVLTDVLPDNVVFVSASAGGKRVGDVVRWTWPVQEPGEQVEASFRVSVTDGPRVVNAQYGVNSAEGVAALGKPVTVRVTGGGRLYLPLLFKSAP